ncbi:MAG: glycosyltransferase family 2 protein [Ramlibacter sp.]
MSSKPESTFLVVTTTWNSVDHIETFLRHYSRLGFERVLVMDFDSTDGTLEILASTQWRGFVELVPFPGIESLDSSNVMLALAKRKFPETHWCLFCDPDELLVTPTMEVGDFGPDLVMGNLQVSVPRFNVTGPRSIAEHDDQRMTARDALALRIDGRCSRNPAIDGQALVLDPPWIFTAIPGKTCVRLGSALSIGGGDHHAQTVAERSLTASAGIYLLHYPFRSYAAFAKKIEMARINFASNHVDQPGYGWQLRRWIRLAESEGLYEEYLQQFIPDGDVESMVQAGKLTRDDAIRNFSHREFC